jgi:hypothetical protein
MTETKKHLPINLQGEERQVRRPSSEFLSLYLRCFKRFFLTFNLFFNLFKRQGFEIRNRHRA